MLLRSLALVGALSTGHACVAEGEYDADVDYFPSKLASDYATGWEVTYHKAYKVIDVGDTKIVAYQCGTPEPTVDGATVTVQIPFESVAVMSTTYVPFFELIGYGQAIKGVSGTDTVSSPCLRDAIAAGDVSNIGSENWAPSISDINAVGADAVFASAWDVGNNLAGIEGAAIPVRESEELTAIGSAEWLEYVALFLNAEEAASAHIAMVASRIDVAEQAVQDTLLLEGTRRKSVLWVYEYDGKLYSGTCPSYYCELVQQAGGEIIDLSHLGDAAAWGAITNFTAFYEAAAAADIWLYPSQNWDTQASMGAVDLAQLPVVQKSRVYDITKNNRCVGGDCTTANDWFESRLAEPDVLLEDLINIITPDAHPVLDLTSFLQCPRSVIVLPQRWLRLTMTDSVCPQEHDRVWLRKVDSESPGDSRTCSGPNDTYDLWADSVAPEAPAGPTPAPVTEAAAAAATVHAPSVAAILALSLAPMVVNAIV